MNDPSLIPDDPIAGKIIHEYDGILEADNQLPRWWVATFVGAILFSGGYWFCYESFQLGKYQTQLYQEELAARAASSADVDEEALLRLAADTAQVQSGSAVFQSNCIVCHGSKGEGLIGPNLTDNAWIHGSKAMSIYTTIREGVGTAGMPGWGPVLGEAKVRAATAYIYSIRNTHVPGKEPQGTVE